MVIQYLAKAKHFCIRLLARNAPAPLIAHLGSLLASLNYMKTVRRVPAYRNIVHKHLGHVPFFVSAKNYGKLPILDKAGYLSNNQIDSLLGEKISTAYSIQRSSGFSGTPSYWLKTVSEARKSVASFRLVWDEYFNPDHESCLVIVGFSLGTWTSGTDILRLCTELAIHDGLQITNISPGENVEETLEIIKKFGRHFRRLIIFGNPIYLKSLVDDGEDIAWDCLPVVFVTGGEPTTEAWRDKDPMRVINAYGASDFGATTATETPLSIRIKRLAMADPALAKTIFGRDGNLPNLFQYHPLSHHIEQSDEKFLVTYWSQIPLVRYNIRDRGRVLPFNQIKGMLAAHGYNFAELCQGLPKRPFRLPFLFVDTRDDGTVSIGGSNVYPGNIETAIYEDSELQPQVEHFYLSILQDDNCDSKLVVQLILRDYDQQTREGLEALQHRASEAILSTLLRDNQEYRVTWQHNPLVTPVIHLLKSEQNQVYSIKRKYIKHGAQSSEAI